MGTIGRRSFVGGLALPGLLAGMASRARGEPLAKPSALPPDANDEAVFAEARGHFLIPEGVVYGNTGTLGASRGRSSRSWPVAPSSSRASWPIGTTPASTASR